MSDFDSYTKEVLDNCLKIMSGKKSDYAENSNRYSNFEESAKIAGITPQQAIINLIGIKLARLRQLTVNGKTPNNESIEDSILDGINYFLILGGYTKGLQ